MEKRKRFEFVAIKQEDDDDSELQVVLIRQNMEGEKTARMNQMDERERRTNMCDFDNKENKISFNFGDTNKLVSYRVNRSLTDRAITSDVTVNIADFFNNFTRFGTKPLLTDKKLVEKFWNIGDDNDARTIIENVGHYVFASCFWDELLRSEIGKKGKRCTEIEVLSRSFVPQLHEYKDELDVERFFKYVNSVQELGLKKKTGNWYDIPGILKIIAFNSETIIGTDRKIMKHLLSDVLKTIPHEVIMMPWRIFKPKGLVPKLSCDKEVS